MTRFTETNQSRRFLAALTILSFTFTQAFPCWAAPDLARRTLRPEMDRAGLEEALDSPVRPGIASRPWGDPPLVVAPQLRRHLQGGPARPLEGRLEVLRGMDRRRVEKIGDSGQKLPERARWLDELLVASVYGGGLTPEEVDPLLAVSLLAGGDQGLRDRAREALQSFGKVCPTCGDHVFHGQIERQDLTADQHQLLHVRAATATAVDFLLTGKVPTVRGVRGGDHEVEPARSAKAMGVMQYAVGEDLPVGVRLEPGEGFWERLNAALLAAGPATLHVRHPRTRGDEADHYIRVGSVALDRRVVQFEDNGKNRQIPISDFERDYLPPKTLNALFTTAQIQAWRQAGGDYAVLSERELLECLGGCGVIYTVGRYAEEGGLASAQDAAYRGKDNTGEITRDLHGLWVVKVTGSPTFLIREIQVEGQGYPEEAMAWYLEANSAAGLSPALSSALERLRQGKPLDNRDHRLIHDKWRSLTPAEMKIVEEKLEAKRKEILALEHYGWVRPNSPGQDAQDRPLRAGVSLPLTKDDLYPIRYHEEGDPAVVQGKKKAGDVDQWNSVGVGNHGAAWSGRPFSISSVSPEAGYADYVGGLREVIGQIQRVYRYDLNAVRDLLRFKLADRLAEAVADGRIRPDEKTQADREYVRLFERVAAAEPLKSAKDMQIWKDLWQCMGGTTLLVAGHVPWDPVRHIFRLQTRLIGTFPQHPEWRREVEENYGKLLSRDRVPARDWMEDWLVENFTNTPGKAFEALTIWLQGKFIPLDVREQMGIERGRVDALTLAHLSVVDRVLRHDRWSTTGSKRPKDAQPHTDTGLLAAVEDPALSRVVAGAVGEIPGRLQPRTGASQQERDRIREQLERAFARSIEAHLRDHPEEVGRPQRAWAHNGDLDPGIQRGITPALTRSGYRPVRRLTAPDGSVLEEPVLTDTWRIVAWHEYIYDAYRKDVQLGELVVGLRYRTGPSTKVGFLPDGYREQWNAVEETLLQEAHRLYRTQPITAEEIAHRLAVMEFARGLLPHLKPGKASSEIGASMISNYDPQFDVAVSHRRPLYIAVVREPDGNIQYQVTSDARTALRMLDRDKVAEGIRESNRILQWKREELDKLDEAREQLSEAAYATREAAIFREAESRQKKVNQQFHLETLISLKGEGKYAVLSKVFDPRTRRFELAVDVSNLQGQVLARYRGNEPLLPPPDREKGNIKHEKNKTLDVDIANKAGSRTYGEKEIKLIPLTLRETRFSYGLRKDGRIDMSRQGVAEQVGDAQVSYGVLADRLKKWFEAGGETLLVTGVGSSENVATAAAMLLEHLTGLRIDTTGPSRLLSTGALFDPQKTMVQGLTWSSTTALVVSVLQWLLSQELLVGAITGNPDVEAGDLVKESLGVIKAHTRQEVAVYTTMGFATMLYDLLLFGYYLNGLMEEVTADPAQKAQLKAKREEVFPDLYRAPDLMRDLEKNPARDIEDINSQINRAADHFKSANGFGFVGSNPILAELGLKVGEVRNIMFDTYEPDDDEPWNLIKAQMPPEKRKGWLLNATDPSRMKEYTAWIRKAHDRGQSVIVQTFDPNTVSFTPEERRLGLDQAFAEFREALDRITREADGKGGRPLVLSFHVPKVHFAVQPLLDVHLGDKFAVALARAAGLTDEAIDTPENLAKSVTVQGVEVPFGALMTPRDFLAKEGAGLEEVEQYGKDLAARWPSLKDPWDQATQRLPIRDSEFIEELTVPDLKKFSLDEPEVLERFGEKLGGLRKVVILYAGDKNAEIAGRMAQVPFSTIESVNSNSSDEKLFAREKNEVTGEYKPVAVRRAVNGREYEIRFDRSLTDQPSQNRLTVTRLEKKDGAVGRREEIALFGDERGIAGVDKRYSHLRQAIASAPQAQTDFIYLVADRWYRITADKGRGLNLTAVEPELLGVEVLIHKPTDWNVLPHIDDKTLVVAVSRSNNRGEEDGRIAGIADPRRGRSSEQRTLAAAKGSSKPEDSLVEFLTRLQRERPQTPIFTVGNGSSALHALKGTVGSAVLPDDLDAVDVISGYYAAFMVLGIELARLKESQSADDYKEALRFVPLLAARTLAMAYQEQVETGKDLFDPEVESVAVPINHRPVDVRFHAGTQTVSFQDVRTHAVASLKVVVDSQGVVRGMADKEASVTIGDRAYHVQAAPERGVIVTSVQPDYLGGGTLRDRLAALRQNERNRQYDTWLVVGGAQDRTSSYAYRMALARQGFGSRVGFLARSLEVDESVHGPLALVRDRIHKFRDEERRQGVSPGYDPNDQEDLTAKDAGFIVLATDSRTYGAAIVDVQRAVTRNGRVILVVKESDRNREEVVTSGAHLILTVPDTFNALTSVSHMVLANVLAGELTRSLRPEYDYRRGSPSAELALLPAVKKQGKHPQGLPLAVSMPPAALPLAVPQAVAHAWVYEGPGAGQVERDPTRKAILTAGASAAVIAHQAGVIGAFQPEAKLPTGFPQWSQGEKERLLALREYLWETWFPRVVSSITPALEWNLEMVQGRLTAARLLEDALLINWAEGGKNLLTANYGAAAVSPEETGSLIYIIAGPGVDGYWRTPPRGMYADMLATYLPKAGRDERGYAEGNEEGFRADLNPSVPVRQIEPTLKRIARWNDIINERGEPDFTRMRVVFLNDRNRERLRVDEFRRLQREKGLQLGAPQDGTVISALAAQLPPPEGGWSRERPLTVVWTVTHVHQAGANLVLTQAMPAGAWMSFRLLPSTINEGRSLSQASQDLPIGGSNKFPPADIQAINKWRESLDDAGRFLSGHIFIPSDVKGQVRGVLVPLTPIGVFGDWFDRVKGIPGVSRVGERRYWSYPITVEGGSFLIERVEVEDLPLTPETVFDPPADLPVAPHTVLAGLRAKFSSFFQDLLSEIQPAGARAQVLSAAFQLLDQAYEDARRSGGSPAYVTLGLPAEQGGPRSTLLIIGGVQDRPGGLPVVQGPFAAEEIGIPKVYLLEHRGVGVLAALVNASEDRVRGFQEQIRRGIVEMRFPPLDFIRVVRPQIRFSTAEEFEGELQALWNSILSYLQFRPPVLVEVEDLPAKKQSRITVVREAHPEFEGRLLAFLREAEKLPLIEKIRGDYQEKPGGPTVTLIRFATSAIIEDPADQARLTSTIKTMMEQLPPAEGAGLEEALTWEEEVAGRDPAAAILQAVRNSDVVRTVSDIQAGRWKAAPVLRPLTDGEVGRLRLQGNRGDFSGIRINADMTADDLTRIEGNRFSGVVEIGRVKEVRGYEIHNSWIGPGVTLIGNGANRLENYVLMEDASVRLTDLTFEPGSAFGIEEPIAVRNEAGLRHVLIYPEMDVRDVLKLAGERDIEENPAHRKLQSDYAKAHRAYVEAVRSPLGVVARWVAIDRAGEVKNSYIGPGAVLDKASSVEDSIILSWLSWREREEWAGLLSGNKPAPEWLPGLSPARIAQLRKDPSKTAELLKRQRTVVGLNASLKHAVLQPGVHVARAPLERVFMMERSRAEGNVLVADAVAGPGTELEVGEVRATIYAGMGVNHHGGLDIAMLNEVGVNRGSGGNASNHGGLGATLEGALGRGIFVGSDVELQYPLDLRGSPHSLIQTRVFVTGNQNLSWPFMLLGAGHDDARTRLGEGARLYTEILPGWVGIYLPYLFLRNERKWRERYEKKGILRHRFNFEIFQPDVVDWMRQARAALRAVEQDPEAPLKLVDPEPGTDWARDGFVYQYKPGPIRDEIAGRPYNVSQQIDPLDYLYVSNGHVEMNDIPGLGNNYLRERNRRRGIAKYTEFIRYYALRGLYRQADRLEKEGRLAELSALLATASQDRRWEHERRILVEEFPGLDAGRVPELLQTFSRLQESFVEAAETPLSKQYSRFNKVMNDAKGVLPKWEHDDFVNKFKQETQEIGARAAELAVAVQAGAEEPPVEAAVEKVHALSMELLKALMARRPELGRRLEISGAPKNLAIGDLERALSFVRADPNSHVESFRPGSTEEEPDRLFLGRFHDEELRVSLLPALERIGEELAQRISGLAAPLIKTIQALKTALAEQVSRVEVSEEVAGSRVLIVTPDALPKLALAWAVSGPNNRPLLVEALAKNGFHKESVEIVLKGLGIAGVRVHDMETEFSGMDGEAAAGVLADRHRQESRLPFIVRPDTTLEELLDFLGRPDAIGQVKALWFIADRSQAIWS